MILYAVNIVFIVIVRAASLI